MSFGTKRYSSWGRYPKKEPRRIAHYRWRHEAPNFEDFEPHVLPFAYGRSYGDSCLNEDGVLLDVTGLNQFIAFDPENGVICCEAGVSIVDVLDVIMPAGWFLPVSPGTRFVSVGGAIANDVHGKNHHRDGTFGCHVTRLELLRSTGERLVCSPSENTELYQATIGGLGLTGIITWAEFKLKPITTPYVQMESIRFANLDEFFEITAESVEDYVYTVSWVDCLATGKNLGRGLFSRGNFYDPPLGVQQQPSALPSIPFPVDLPGRVVNQYTVKAFNELYYRKQLMKHQHVIAHYKPFFYPLDAITDWYRGYGKSGFVQYQFVVPFKNGYEHVREIFKRIARSGQGSPLVVFKTFGTRPSPGMLSFPREGVTLALDFAFRGEKTLKLLEELDQIVFENNGALYPAKDSRMSGEGFRASFPNWETFANHIDPKFSSSFWRRVTC